MLAQRQDLVTQAHTDILAYHPTSKSESMVGRERSKFYGKKVKPANLFRSALRIDTFLSSVCDEKNVKLRVRSIDLLWKPAGRQACFALVMKPARSGWC